MFVFRDQKPAILVKECCLNRCSLDPRTYDKTEKEKPRKAQSSVYVHAYILDCICDMTKQSASLTTLSCFSFSCYYSTILQL